MLHLKLEERNIFITIARILLIADLDQLNVLDLGLLILELMHNEMIDTDGEKIPLYSDNLNQLVKLMTDKNPSERPSFSQIKNSLDIQMAINSLIVNDDEKHKVNLESKIESIDILIKLASICSNRFDGGMMIMCLSVLTEMIIVEFVGLEKDEDKQFLKSVILKISGIERLRNMCVNSPIREARELISGMKKY
jgi:hypothetical protein